MDELKDVMTQRAIALHTRHVRASFRSHEDHSSYYSQYSGYSSYAMGFVKFAAQEKYLFRWLYLDGKQFETYQDDVLLSEIMTEYGYTEEIAGIISQRVHGTCRLLWGIPHTGKVQKARQKGIPFEMKLPRTAPLTYGSLTKEQFDKEIEKGMSDVKAGRVYSADAIEAEMKRDFGI